MNEPLKVMSVSSSEPGMEDLHERMGNVLREIAAKYGELYARGVQCLFNLREAGAGYSVCATNYERIPPEMRTAAFEKFERMLRETWSELGLVLLFGIAAPQLGVEQGADGEPINDAGRKKALEVLRETMDAVESMIAMRDELNAKVNAEMKAEESGS